MLHTPIDEPPQSKGPGDFRARELDVRSKNPARNHHTAGGVQGVFVVQQDTVRVLVSAGVSESTSYFT